MFSVEKRTSEDVKTFFALFLILAENWTCALCRRDDLFFALRLILDGKFESCLFALIYVGSAKTNCLT